MASLTRRELLKTSGGALVAATASAALTVEPVAAQAPRRGGVFRFAMQLDPQGFDPHATVSFVTMIPLSFSHSRLVKVKAGPSVKPGTYPIEPDVAESWTRSNDTTYVFKLRTWLAAREYGEKFGDFKKVESAIGTGPWMLERWAIFTQPDL